MKVWHFQDVVCLFWYDIKILLKKNFLQNLNEILHNSGNIKSSKKADHILEMSGLGVFCDNYLLNFTSRNRLTRLTNKYRKIYQISRRFSSQIVLLLSCFVGHPEVAARLNNIISRLHTKVNDRF